VTTAILFQLERSKFNMLICNNQNIILKNLALAWWFITSLHKIQFSMQPWV